VLWRPDDGIMFALKGDPRDKLWSSVGHQISRSNLSGRSDRYLSKWRVLR
jgi:hypothetical protein